ncbi:hypothetical protein M1D69_05565 [Bacillus sp. PK3-037]
MAQISSTNQKPERLFPDIVTYEVPACSLKQFKASRFKRNPIGLGLGNDGTFQFTVFIKIPTKQPV